MDSYYYLISSLPYLRFEDTLSLSKEEFIAECDKWLSPEAMEALLSADRRIPAIKAKDTELLLEWKRFDQDLREKLAHIRSAKKRGETASVPEELRSVLEEENPFLMERALEEIRWAFIEGKTVGHFFDIDNLILYFLKLQILERLESFDKDEGEKAFYNICEVKHDEIIG